MIGYPRCWRSSLRGVILLTIAIAFAVPLHHARANDLVDIKSVAPTIVIDLRYATANNVTGRPLYSPGMRAYVIPSVALQLAGAQKFLRNYNTGIKIWDAYRPKQAQELLWQLAHKGDYVTNPEGGVGSLHSWGVAVDATLVDIWGHELKMPTGFDEFTPEAAMYYHGADPVVQSHLRLLQVAMAANNFYGLRIEWWHFVTSDWKKYVPASEIEKKTDANAGPAAKVRAAAQKKANSKT